jgi:hypothetical protein
MLQEREKMTFSINRLILEPYVKDALRKELNHGIATPGQRDGVKGLSVLMDGRLADGTKIFKGSTVYIKEEVLHNHATTIFKLHTCATLSGKFMIVDPTYVEFYEIPEGDLRA